MTRRGPSRIAESIVALLLPPACREEVLGDLHERFESPARYALDALRTIPLVILSRIRRTAHARALVVQGFALYLAFLAGARLAGGALLEEQLGMLRLAIPPAMLLLGLVLDDVYARPGPRSALHLMRGVLPGIALALVSQEILRAGGSALALPRWVALDGCAIALLFASAIRVWFAPPAARVPGAAASQPAATEFPMPPKTKIVLLCMLLILAATVFSIVTTSRPHRSSFTYSQFLDRLQQGEVAAVVIDAGNSGAVEATLRMKDGQAARTVLPANYRDALRAMQDQLVSVEIRGSGPGAGQWLLKASPFLLVLGVWIVLVIRRSGGQPLVG
jgi:hypothetical protein